MEISLNFIKILTKALRCIKSSMNSPETQFNLQGLSLFLRKFWKEPFSITQRFLTKTLLEKYFLNVHYNSFCIFVKLSKPDKKFLSQSVYIIFKSYQVRSWENFLFEL